MQCSHCNKSDWVTIGNQKYCTNCGQPADGAAASPVPVRATSSSPAESSLADTTRDLKPLNRTVNPANSFHTAPKPASPNVLDLRPKTPTVPTPTTVAVSVNTAASEPVAPVTPATPEPAGKTQERLARAASVNKSDLIKRFVKPQNTSSASPIVPVEATPVAVPPPAAITPPPAPELSNHVATQLDALRQMVPATETSKPTPGLPNPKAIMATTLAIAIMGGYIWLNNFKDLTVQAAAQKAGLSINMPSYMPSSYNLSGPISYGPGYLTMQYKSPSNETPLVLTQRKTDWSSASLLELFVNPKAKDYVTVQTQGLTIYVYNGNQATWVNRGKQFVIEGNTKLSKEQIVKIAESL